MQRFAISVLVAVAALLMLYPLWGLLGPESYVLLLYAEFGLSGDVAPDLVQRSAAMNWASNGILASSFVCLAGFVADPTRTIHARWAAGCLIAYPFVRATVLAWMGFTLTSHTEDPEFIWFLRVEDTVYLVFGIALLGILASRTEQVER